jgi:hypothetical protein
MKCPVPNEALGTDYAKACGEGGRAETINGLFDEWDDARRGLPVSGIEAPRIGTVDWLFREYRQSKAYTEKVAVRSRKNYEWATRKRHAHALANQIATAVQNAMGDNVQNEKSDSSKSA